MRSKLPMPIVAARDAAILLVSLGACLTMGCASRDAAPAATQPATPEGNAALLHHIADQPYVTADAGYRAIYVLWKREAFSGSFAELSSLLRENRIIDTCWNHEPATRLTRADVGFMVCRACDIRTGINWMVSGMGRYAWRELQFNNIAGGGGELGYIRGGELVAVLARAGEYRERQAGHNPDELVKDETQP
ncbi:MAG: hypothetical protein JNG88_01095 [Phycisphaerales bacterium]|nr:hypothetical protein [Phycisphaerales bacterium]